MKIRLVSGPASRRILTAGSVGRILSAVSGRESRILRNSTRGMEMRKTLACAIAGLVVVLVFSLVAAAQGTQGTQARPNQATQARSPWKFYPMDRAIGDGGPAPKRDLTGTWAGPSSGMAVPRGDNTESPTAPPLTPLGKQLFDMNKPIGIYSPAGTNDPHTRFCDPYGFPQNMTNHIRGLQIATLPNKVFMLIQFMTIWREIWTDGRALPTNVGMPGQDPKNAVDPRYNGYSVGRWEDDYNFVVETTGMNDVTWATKNGYPHTMEARVIERFTRVSKNDMKLHITMIDPKLYTQPFVFGAENFRWVPNQQLDEWLCIPSEQQEYLKTMADPAGFDAEAAAAERGAAGGAGRGAAGAAGRGR